MVDFVYINEYKLNRDKSGNLIIITTNPAVIDTTFADKYYSFMDNTKCSFVEAISGN